MFVLQVHSSYGEELGFNSDEEGYGRDAVDDVPPLPIDTDSVCTTWLQYSTGSGYWSFFIFVRFAFDQFLT